MRSDLSPKGRKSLEGKWAISPALEPITLSWPLTLFEAAQGRGAKEQLSFQGQSPLLVTATGVLRLIRYSPARKTQIWAKSQEKKSPAGLGLFLSVSFQSVK